MPGLPLLQVLRETPRQKRSFQASICELQAMGMFGNPAHFRGNRPPHRGIFSEAPLRLLAGFQHLNPPNSYGLFAWL